MLETRPVSGRPQAEAPATPSRVEEVLAQALAYDPDVLIPVSFTGTGSLLDWEHTVAACWNEQAQADVHKFADLAMSRQHVAVMTAGSAEARESPRWQNLILPDGFRHELRAVAVDDHGHCWGSVTAFRDGRRSFTDKDIAAAGRDLNLIAGRLSRAMVGGAATPQPATLPAFGSATPASCYPPQAPHQYLHRPRSPQSSL